MSVSAYNHQCGRLCVNSCIFPGVDDESFSPGDDSVFDPAPHEDEGSNLVDSRPPVVIQEAILLDLPRDTVDGGLFESYTDTGTLSGKLTDTRFLSLSTCLSLLVTVISLSIFPGISSPLLRFKPFSLRPGSRYMLEVTASEFCNNNRHFSGYSLSSLIQMGQKALSEHISSYQVIVEVKC